MNHLFTERSITLIRHGPPAVSLQQRVAGHQFRQFVARYDAAKIDQSAAPPAAAQALMAQAAVVFVSDLPRATHTAELLGAMPSPIVNAQFREIQFPVDFVCRFKLSAFMWSAIAILLWRLGYSADSESWQRTWQRVHLAVDLLEARSQTASPVVLVAHGGINQLIAKELRQRGWQGPKSPRSEHWGCTTYRLAA